VITDTVAPDPGGGRNYRLAVSLVSSPQTPDIVNGIRPGAGPAAVPALRPPGCRDPWLRMEPDWSMTAPLAGQPGHGRTAFVRRQPARIVDDRAGGGYADVFELICPSCGDHPYLDYTEVPPRLQWLRGPRALDAYHKHIGASLRPDGDRAGSLGCPLPGPRCPGHVSGVPLVTTGPGVQSGSVSPVLAGAFLRRRSQQVNDRPGAADGMPGSWPRWCR
jgi:hypothetical protein